MACADELSDLTLAWGEALEAMGAYVRDAYSTYQEMEDDLKANLKTVFTGDGVALNYIDNYFASNNPFSGLHNAGSLVSGVDVGAGMLHSFGDTYAGNFKNYAKLTAFEVTAAKLLDPELTSMAALTAL